MFKFFTSLFLLCFLFINITHANDCDYQTYLESRIKSIKKATKQISLSNKVWDKKFAGSIQKNLKILSNIDHESGIQISKQIDATKKFHNSTTNVDLFELTKNKDIDTVIAVIYYLQTNTAYEKSIALCKILDAAEDAVYKYKVAINESKNQLAFQQNVIARFNELATNNEKLRKSISSMRLANGYLSSRLGNIQQYLNEDMSNIKSTFSSLFSQNNTINSAVSQSLSPKAQPTISVAKLQTNIEVLKEIDKQLYSLSSNKNALSNSIKPGFRKFNSLKKDLNLRNFGTNYKMNPYKTMRIKDRVEKTFDIKPMFYNRFNSFALSAFIQTEYHLNYRSSAGIYIGGDYYKNAIYTGAEQAINKHVCEGAVFFNYFLYKIINLYGSYTPITFFENMPKAPANYEHKLNYAKVGDIALGIRLKPHATKKVSNNIYLLYVISKNGIRYFDYRLGINF